MKNLISKSVLTLAIAIVSIACSKDETAVTTQDSDNSAAEITLMAQSGSWRISYFWDTDKDETSNFAGYVFNFNADGTLVAVKGSTTITGTWSVTDDNGNSSNDDSGYTTDDDDFNILFSVPPGSDFDDLNDDWHIITVTDNRMELTDVSGGNGGTDYLTFVKN